MPILKNKTPGSFVMIGKDILKNTDLKLVDRGMLATLLSLPDKWDFSVVGLAKILPEGKSAIQASLSRLEHSGYLTRTQERGEHGKYGDTFLEVHQVPISPCTENLCTDNRHTEKQDAEKRYTENMSQFKNKASNNNELKNKQYSQRASEKRGGYDSGNDRDKDKRIPKNTIRQMKNGQMQKQNCMAYKCPVCRDTGIELYSTDDGHEYARNCKCGLWQRERMNRMLSFADIPEAFAGLRLDSFDTSIYDMANSRKIADMNMQIANYWLDDFEKMQDRGKGLYMYSAVKGSGKTRFAVSLANEVIERYVVGVKFATSVQILNEIKASWNSDTQMTEHRLLDELTEVDVLVIDDFGIEVPKDWSMERFYQIVNSRYIHKR